MTDQRSFAHQACAYIRQAHPHIQPKIGIVLGSGLGSLAEELEEATYIDYSLLPGFPNLTVAGHANYLILGKLHGVDVVCLQGRAHSYEGAMHEAVKTYVRTLRLLGCEYFLATNASGSLREDVPPGEIMLITDHINFQPGNPLIGPNDDEFGPRFYPLDNAYDIDMRQTLLSLAATLGITLYQGVYISVLGPNYETSAEIRAFRQWGADAVGMSTVPEVLVANHCGMKVAVLATITNYATGLAHTAHSHEAVVEMARQAATKLSKLVKRYIETLQPTLSLS